MDPRIKAMRLERWREIIIACNTSGMKKNEWMKIHNIDSKSFYRRQKELREYEMEKAGITVSDIPVGQKPSEYFDLTTALIRQTNDISTPIGIKDKNSVPSQMNQPELVIQAGSYHLYIGSGITESTLTTVLRAISHA